MYSMIVLAFAAVVAHSQENSCVYSGGPHHKYVLNLTAISGWTLEYDSSDGSDYYYTPCRNDLHCRQGNADYSANTAQFVQRSNECAHYLSVDHHTWPEYSFSAAAWIFHFEDGEMCERRNEPRTAQISYLCSDQPHGPPAHLVNVEEREMCSYTYNIHSRLACVNESAFNEECQWKVHNHHHNESYLLDLSSLKGQTLRAENPNHYETYFSPCQNGLNCYQQTHHPVMAIMENRATGTCERFLAVWEKGRVQPSYYNDGSQSYFQFHYFSGEPCHEQQDLDDVFIVNYICDPNVPTYKVLNETSPMPCFWEMNVATALACNPTEDIVIKTKPF